MRLNTSSNAYIGFQGTANLLSRFGDLVVDLTLIFNSLFDVLTSLSRRFWSRKTSHLILNSICFQQAFQFHLCLAETETALALEAWASSQDGTENLHSLFRNISTVELSGKLTSCHSLLFNPLNTSLRALSLPSLIVKTLKSSSELRACEWIANMLSPHCRANQHERVLNVEKTFQEAWYYSKYC